MKKIVVFGPGPQFKGGIANYNTSLAKAMYRKEDVEVHIVSWIQQYPAIIPRDFIDRKSKSDQLAGTHIKVHYLLDYNRSQHLFNLVSRRCPTSNTVFPHSYYIAYWLQLFP